MTETSPIATTGMLQRSIHDGLSDDELADVRATAGQAAPLVDLRLVDPDTGEVQPWDGATSGELQASGPWIADSYYLNEDGGKQFTDGRLAAHRRRGGHRRARLRQAWSTARRTW